MELQKHHITNKDILIAVSYTHLLPGSVEGSVKWFQEHPHPDIIFLDIHLTDGISFTFIEQTQTESMIIFTTAYDEYAIRAFTVNSIDYLLKPINRGNGVRAGK